MSRSHVHAIFDHVAAEYDAQRRVFIPCFDDFYRAALEMLPFPAEAAIRVVDLGAGTGLLSALLAAAYPQAQITLVDLSAPMLEQAQARFAGQRRIRYLTADYLEAELPAADAVVSALSIHHLPDAEKRALYQHVFTCLAPGGVFVNADLTAGATPAVQARFRELWIQHMRERGLTDDMLAEWDRRGQIDQLAPLEPQLHWLREIGYRDVDCLYRMANFAVFGGYRA